MRSALGVDSLKLRCHKPSARGFRGLIAATLDEDNSLNLVKGELRLQFPNIVGQERLSKPVDF